MEQEETMHIDGGTTKAAHFESGRVEKTLEQEAAEMDAKGDLFNAPAADRPKWLPEKFKSAEELAKAYDELQKKMGEVKPAHEGIEKEEEVKVDEAKVDEVKTEEPPKQEDTKDDAYYKDIEKYETEFAEKGVLSEETYQDIAKKYNAPKELVDQIIRNNQIAQQHSKSAAENAVYSAVGGKDSYTEMATWAKANLPAGQLDAYNAVVNSGNVDQIQLAANGLMAQYKNANGPKLATGHTKSTSSGGKYNSYQEFMKDLNDSRYKSGDQHFQKQVMAKLKNSPNI